MRYYSEIIITPEEFSSQDIIQKDFSFSLRREALIIGTVFNASYEAVEGACVLIRRVNTSLQTKEVIGYIITNEVGEFAFLVKKQDYLYYQLEVYEPLDRSLKVDCLEEQDEYSKK